MSDLQTGLNHVFLSDERAMGKDCDALSSLRWAYHLRLFIASRDVGKLADAPDTLYLIMDNCVGIIFSILLFVSGLISSYLSFFS